MRKLLAAVAVLLGFGMLIGTGVIALFFASSNSASAVCNSATGSAGAQAAQPNPVVPVAAVSPGHAGSYGGAQLDATQVGNARAIFDTAAKVLPSGEVAYGQVIGITTAMGESTLNVINHGDIAGPDSRGLFQQRAQGWGPLSQRMDPVGSATSFFNALTNVPMWTQMTVTEAAHRVQGNKDPNHYVPSEPVGRALAASFGGKPAVNVVPAVQTVQTVQQPACKSSTGTTGTAVNVTLAGPGGGAKAQAAVVWALAHLGLAYSQANRYGPSSYDCSSFTMTAWKSAGVTIPGIADAQFHWATPVPIGSELPGDLAFPKSEVVGGVAGHVVLIVSKDAPGFFTMASEHHSGTVSSVDHGMSEADYIFGRVH